MTENPEAPHWKMRKGGGFILFSWLPPVEAASSRQYTTCRVFGPGWPSDHILLHLSWNQKWLGSCLLPWAALVMYVVSLLTLTHYSGPVSSAVFARHSWAEICLSLVVEVMDSQGDFFFPPLSSQRWSWRAGDERSGQLLYLGDIFLFLHLSPSCQGELRLFNGAFWLNTCETRICQVDSLKKSWGQLRHKNQPILHSAPELPLLCLSSPAFPSVLT